MFKKIKNSQESEYQFMKVLKSYFEILSARYLCIISRFQVRSNSSWYELIHIKINSSWNDHVEHNLSDSVKSWQSSLQALNWRSFFQNVFAWVEKKLVKIIHIENTQFIKQYTWNWFWIIAAFKISLFFHYWEFVSVLKKSCSED